MFQPIPLVTLSSQAMKVYKTYDIIETEFDVRNFLSLCCMTSAVLWSRVQLTNFNVRHNV